MLCCVAAPLTAQNDDLFWVQTNGPKDTYVSQVAADTCGNIWASTIQGLYKSSDLGETWTVTPTLQDSIIASVLILPDGGILAGGREVVYRSTDCGNTWREFRGENVPRIEFYDMASGSNGIVYAGSGGNYARSGFPLGMYWSMDNGATWELTCMWGFDADVVAVHPNGDLYGGFGIPTGVLRSQDRGETCEQLLKPEIPLPNFDVTDIGFDSQGNIYTTTDFNDIMYSTDEGDSWTHTNWNGVTRNSKLYAIFIDKRDRLYIGSSSNLGVITSSENGVTVDTLKGNWEFGNAINDFAADSSGYLYVATRTGGVYRSRFPTLATGIREASSHTALATLAATPNPFNDAARITFTLPNNGYIRLSVTDALGHLTFILAEGPQAAGTHAMRFASHGLSSGVYNCRLEYNGAVTGIRLLLLR